MAVDKIQAAGDERIEYRSATVNGRNYGYLLSQPQLGKYRATIFLIHGFPDLSMGWRYQIPMLVDLGLRVVAPDSLGYGRTDAPDSPTEYSYKRCADDIKALASHLGESKIILGGHDWGAGLVYRVALWHPDLVSHLFTVCVPYFPPRADYTALEDLVRTVAPHFGYQVQFASGDVEKIIRSKTEIKQFLTTLYGGRTETGELGIDISKGVLAEKLPAVRPSRLVNEEVNYEDELAILDRQITVPVLFVQALRDVALPPHLGKAMARLVPNLAQKQVDTGHWALWEKPQEVNEIIVEWFQGVVFKGERSGSL
ncbi:uncharacterized protein N7459_004767 [Penicillium hispanicum]|uniref:uncharacterized protein n=1 Tax=Penicillium hispanicum TaxID=1080232 RepID=UPI002541F237|nr:uncharacterized protein N7459_004767 [Penicillium hispanicum]KAJ5584967.1 hypothetical protein N7459_004767 [Penicillium hispanicum]